MTDCLFCHGSGKHDPKRYDAAHPLDRAINESHRYRAMLYDAWQALRGQTKGLQRQRRLIKRLRAENARLREACNKFSEAELLCRSSADQQGAAHE